MSSANKNLSVFSDKNIIDISKKRFGIVVSEWNKEITDALFKGAYDTLIEHGADKDRIYILDVPGSFELTLGAQKLAKKEKIDAVIALGCVIQGETKHFDFICNAVANGITNLNIKYDKPVIFGVLTPNNQQQAIDRAGGKHGNKGIEAAITAIKMLAI
ncbi:MAG: 6,7-dimethyl-8-ribityllumazine synthase [Cytophagales bacterium]